MYPIEEVKSANVGFFCLQKFTGNFVTFLFICLLEENKKSS